MSSLKYWVWLSSLSGIGAVTASRLLNHFGTPEAVYNAGAFDYRDVEGLNRADVSQLLDKNMETANKILASCHGIGCRVVTLQDAEYPDRLRNIYDPPITLYVRGSLPVIDEEPVVAIVGTRDCTPYGITAADKMGYNLARSGLTVVTGLARGIDSAATIGALRSGGVVLAVIGSGLDIVYPPENGELYSSVARSGAIISEYPPGTSAKPAHFPMRNRILSGLSLGVVVIEAPKRSGALITAMRALEQGRDVFALPGNVDARSCEGSNALLREGAIPIINADDIISEYIELFPDKIIPEPEKAPEADPNGFDESVIPGAINRNDDKKVIDNVSKVDYIDLDKILSQTDGDEHTVAKAIGRSGFFVDEIINRSGLSAQQVQTALTMLEIKGLVTRDGSGKWLIQNS